MSKRQNKRKQHTKPTGFKDELLDEPTTTKPTTKPITKPTAFTDELLDGPIGDIVDVTDAATDVNATDVNATVTEPIVKADADADADADANAAKLIPYKQLEKSLIANWINKESNLEETIIETTDLLRRLPETEFNENIDKMAQILSETTNADGNKIFRNIAEATDYLRKMRKRSPRSGWSTKHILQNDDMQREIRYENSYNKQLSKQLYRSNVATNLQNTDAKLRINKNNTQPLLKSLYLKAYS